MLLCPNSLYQQLLYVIAHICVSNTVTAVRKKSLFCEFKAVSDALNES